MSGSVYRGYGNASTPSAEYNVRECASCSELLYTAGWPVTITPLDTCGTVSLSGSVYDVLLKGSSHASQVLAQSLIFWAKHLGRTIDQQTDTWFDAVAVYLSLSPVELNFEKLHLTVTTDGYTKIDPNGPIIDCALTWKNQTAFELNLAQVLAGAN